MSSERNEKHTAMKSDHPDNLPPKIRRLLVELPEARYRADMELYQQDQALNAELLRLSLAGIGVVGFLLTLLVEKIKITGLDDVWFAGLVIAAVVGFAIAAMGALKRRMVAASAMFHHIKNLKEAKLMQEGKLEVSSADRPLENPASDKMMAAQKVLNATVLVLAVAAGLLGGAFVRMLFILLKSNCVPRCLVCAAACLRWR